MELEQAVSRLKALQKTLSAYGYITGVMQYDAMTVAPEASVEPRAETLGFFAGEQHRLLTGAETGELVEYLHEHKDEMDAQTAREVYLLKKQRDQLARIPADEYTAYVALLARADVSWHQAKAASDFSLFQSDLEQIVAANIRLAGYYDAGKAPYDALLNEFEKGATMEMLDAFFAKLRETIVPLVHQIGQKAQPDDRFLHGDFSVEEQAKLSHDLMDLIGLDKKRCILGTTEHPFTDGFNRNDVRITTHYYPEYLASTVYSVIHEGGHALYELDMDPCLDHSVAAGGASLGIHESQSRFYENIIGRSRPFMDLLLPRMKRYFPAQLEDVTADQLYAAVNKAEPSLVRTEADELTYCLHIMVRYEIEKQLIAGTLAVKDIPQAWNQLYRDYLGVEVPNDREGCLQDSHWSGGAIGYFPSYALGSAYGAQMLHAMEQDFDVEAAVAAGDIARVTAWLCEKVHRYGSMKDPADIIRFATGESFDACYYTNYLKKKFSALYGL